jgi:hypothetical protein
MNDRDPNTITREILSCPEPVPGFGPWEVRFGAWACSTPADDLGVRATLARLGHLRRWYVSVYHPDEHLVTPEVSDGRETVEEALACLPDLMRDYTIAVLKYRNLGLQKKLTVTRDTVKRLHRRVQAVESSKRYQDAYTEGYRRGLDEARRRRREKGIDL